MQLDKVQMQLNFGITDLSNLTLNTLRFSASLSVINEILPRVLSQLFIYQKARNACFTLIHLPIVNMGKAIRTR